MTPEELVRHEEDLARAGYPSAYPPTSRLGRLKARLRAWSAARDHNRLLEHWGELCGHPDEAGDKYWRDRG